MCRLSGRGAFLKADDTYKLWHFHSGYGAIGFAGDTDVAREFVRRFTPVAREFNAIEKSRDDGDMDIRIGQYQPDE